MAPSYLIGKTCKLTEFGVALESEYQTFFGIGNPYKAQRMFDYCHRKDNYQLSLMFVDEKPFTRDGVTWYCLKEVGKHSDGDYHWFTLDQVVICEN